MQVVGVTTQQEVYVVSRERKFRINEILVIEDPALNHPQGEVVETMSYNRLIPMGLDKSLVDAQVIDTLEQIGYDIESDEINLAKLRLYEEAPHPVRTGCPVRLPSFEEVRHLLVKTSPDEGMTLGEIRGTESMGGTISDDLKDRVVMMEHGELRPQEGVPFIFDIQSMQQYPHVGIFGGSGSGKSFGLRVMLEELMKLRIPALVFDPHFEMDFSDPAPGLSDRAPDFRDLFVTVQIGKEVGISFSDLSTRDVVELLRAAGSQLSDSMVNVIQMLHRPRDSFETFSDRIGNLVQALDEGKQGLERQLRKKEDLTPVDVQRIQELMQLLQQYGSLPPSSVKGVDWRLKRLDKAGLFQRDIRSIEQGLEQGKLVVVQGNAWILQVFATYVTGTLYRKRREYKDARMNGEEGHFFPPFVIVTDEAHNFAPKSLDSPAKSILKEIAQEGRKYGVFLFLATQRPTLLDETITAQLNTKFVFRTVRATDIATLREETDLTPEEGKRLPYLRSGDTFVSSAAFGRTVFIRIRAAYTQSPHLANPFDELKRFSAQQDQKLLDTLTESLPVFETDLMQVLDRVNQECGLNWDVHRLRQELERLSRTGKLTKHETPFAVRYDRGEGLKV
ncbi:ATP-binding protein [Thermoactinomyces intermedius]|uniref:ATP-binding protein n=1 Tax=Thermoactinomyces intermedius TaxID=2024 RepID=A0A8I1AD02_THEIN|nr:ATP-binding protein [Thermoactinomyces intermedius]MBA4549286.1 ATP-binding protein [Thermoactinomyces intermedius]MBA4835350.1 ATP-binding protein [Thermoactinomyces intermedius]MBH8595567.1 ATP-binding protein [Thermoactinomyces intermedius]